MWLAKQGDIDGGRVGFRTGRRARLGEVGRRGRVLLRRRVRAAYVQMLVFALFGGTPILMAEPA